MVCDNICLGDVDFACTDINGVVGEGVDADCVALALELLVWEIPDEYDDWYDAPILYTWAGKCVLIECLETEIRDPDTGECFTMAATCQLDYCSIENEW